MSVHEIIKVDINNIIAKIQTNCYPYTLIYSMQNTSKTSNQSVIK